MRRNAGFYHSVGEADAFLFWERTNYKADEDFSGRGQKGVAWRTLAPTFL